MATEVQELLVLLLVFRDLDLLELLLHKHGRHLRTFARGQAVLRAALRLVVGFFMGCLVDDRELLLDFLHLRLLEFGALLVLEVALAVQRLLLHRQLLLVLRFYPLEPTGLNLIFLRFLRRFVLQFY